MRYILSMRFFFIPILLVTTFTTLFSQVNKKSDLLIGKWQMYTYATTNNGKLEISYEGYYKNIYEYKKDGSFIATFYKADSLDAITTGNWELNTSDTIRYLNLTLSPPEENVISIMLPDKLMKITSTELILSNGFYIERSVYPSNKKKIPKTYFKRIE
jgi:hypothetical protein